MKSITQSLSTKLLITLGFIIIIGGGISWYILINNGKKTLVNNTIQYTASYSELVKSSTRYSMLTYHREAIQKTIEDIGSAENIRRIRIFDSKGKVFYSSRKEELGQEVDKSSTACFGCHTDPKKPTITLTGKNQWVIYKGREGHRILTFVEPLYNEPSCYTAACHIHHQEQRVLGILETDFSLAMVDKAIERQTLEITIYAFIFMGLSFIILYFILQRLVLKPVSILSGEMRRVAGGDLTRKVSIASQDEISILGRVFNTMTEELRAAREKMENWTQALETEVAKKTEELKKSQDKLIQAEKLASLGRLTLDVAHEIRNPLSSIGGFARRLYKIATNEKEKDYANIIVCEIGKLENILRDVLTFSREARHHLERHNPEEVLHDALVIYEELCSEHHINIEVNIEEGLPLILIDKEQVKRALQNLITNAIDAMPDGGILKATVGKEDLYGVTFIFLKISDTGSGIPEEKLPLIFEPFFSTKEIGHGTGLGLSITRKIIEEHGGFIKAESEVGKGSTFSLYFPYQSEEESLKMNCWEYMKCGRDKDATIKCPAFPNFGRVCWVVAGTFCEGKVQGTFAQKYEDCRKCEFYQKRRNAVL